MKKITVTASIFAAMYLATPAISQAGVSEKVAAGFAAKYSVCAKKLKNVRRYSIAALVLKRKAKDISADHIGNGYILDLMAAKKRARGFSVAKCKRIADKAV
jgi:hypothetical protein